MSTLVWIAVAVVAIVVVFFVWKKKHPEDEAKLEQEAKDLYSRIKK